MTDGLVVDDVADFVSVLKTPRFHAILGDLLIDIDCGFT